MPSPPDRTTIFAISTAPGRAGVALIRVSGPRAGAVLNLMARPRPKPRVAGARVIIHPLDSRPLDRGIPFRQTAGLEVFTELPELDGTFTGERDLGFPAG